MKQIAEVVGFCYRYCEKVEKGIIGRIFLSKLYANIYPLISAYFLKLVLDMLGKPGGTEATSPVLGFVIVMLIWYAADAISQYLFRYQLMEVRGMQRKLTVNLEADLAYLHASLPIKIIESPGFRDEYVTVKREAGFRMFTILGSVVDLLAAAAAMLVSGIVIAKYGWVYLGIMIAVTSVRAIGLEAAVKKMVTAAEISAKGSRLWEVYIGFLESGKSAYESRILGIKDVVVERLKRLMRETVGIYLKTERELFGKRVMGAIVPMSGVFTIGILMITKVLKGLVTVGDWQMMFVTSIRFQDQSKNVFDGWVTLKECGVYVRKLMNIFNRKGDIKDNGKEFPAGKVNMVEFDNVSFRYENTTKWALRKVNFTIKENENIAIVGVNGAGKTTLVKLLCNFYKPTEGRILINGTDIWEYNMESYWKMFSALFQDFERYGMTVQESIGFGDVERMGKLDEIKSAARLIGMDDYFESLPHKYKTPLIRDLENGVDLSTGQWQKTALARALFRNSQIIILDEPTSNLDPQSEEEIFEKLIDTVSDRMMILISHRFSTVKRADRILVISKGSLAEEGTHEALLKRKGLYAKLFKIQARSYKT